MAGVLKDLIEAGQQIQTAQAHQQAHAKQTAAQIHPDRIPAPVPVADDHGQAQDT